MKSLKYGAIFTPDEGGISVEFPDLPGCLTYGDDIDHAYEMAKEAMGLWLSEYLINGDYPQTTPMEQIIKNLNDGLYEDDDFQREPGALVMLVEVNPVYLKEINNKAIRINTSIPQWLKAAADANDINISQVLQEALKEKLGV